MQFYYGQQNELLQQSVDVMLALNSNMLVRLARVMAGTRCHAAASAMQKGSGSVLIIWMHTP